MNILQSVLPLILPLHVLGHAGVVAQLTLRHDRIVLEAMVGLWVGLTEETMGVGELRVGERVSGTQLSWLEVASLYTWCPGLHSSHIDWVLVQCLLYVLQFEIGVHLVQRCVLMWGNSPLVQVVHPLPSPNASW